MKELINAFGYVGIRQVAGVLFGLVRSKVLATSLGTLGLGVVSQGTTLMRLLQNVSALGIGSGFMKLLAEFHAENDMERVNRTIATVLGLFGILGLIVIVLSFVLSDQISI
ncbi:MAG: oligosaccharide flippase family protein [Chloroflexi bacterium]|nr:oligosaccharide flippase family protein [Chloroflexota bacterium]